MYHDMTKHFNDMSDIQHITAVRKKMVDLKVAIRDQGPHTEGYDREIWKENYVNKL